MVGYVSVSSVTPRPCDHLGTSTCPHSVEEQEVLHMSHNKVLPTVLLQAHAALPLRPVTWLPIGCWHYAPYVFARIYCCLRPQRWTVKASVSLFSHGRLAVLWCANGTAACLPWFVIMQSGGRGAFFSAALQVRSHGQDRKKKKKLSELQSTHRPPQWVPELRSHDPEPGRGFAGKCQKLQPRIAARCRLVLKGKRAEQHWVRAQLHRRDKRQTVHTQCRSGGVGVFG